MNPSSSIYFSFFFFWYIAVIVQAHDFTSDEYWLKRAQEAQEHNSQAYHPNPEEVTDHLNEAMHGAVNSTRRNLARKYKGTCMATNPIDQCWKCQRDWEKNRKKLAECGLGFGRNAMGGKNGRIYVVTDASDHLTIPKPGTLRYGATRKEPLWIIFQRDMIITLMNELIVASDKTIDARGANVHIAFGGSIVLQYVRNVIIHGLHIHDIKPGKGAMIMDSENHMGHRVGNEGDGITIYGSSNIWIDHVSLYECSDGLIDITQGSTAVTISNCHFTRHNKVMLFGRGEEDGALDRKMQVTVAFNHFGKGLSQRMPRCRFGFFHIVNNEYTTWEMYAIGGSSAPTIISQGNRFRHSHDMDATREVTKRELAKKDEWMKWTWRSEGDLMLDGAFFVESGKKDNYWPAGGDRARIKPLPGKMVPEITRFAGSLTCKVNQPC